MVTASEDMNAAISLCETALKERDAARLKACENDHLRSRIDRLEYDLTMIRLSRDEARNETKIASIPMDEAQAMARAEVRAVLLPYLTDGLQGMRMLALTLKADMDARWGKEPQ